MKEPIETERLILRELIASDDKGMFELDSNPNVHVFVGKKPVKDIEESRSHIKIIQQQYKDFGAGRWAVVLKESGEFIGWSGIKFITNEINQHKDFYEIGYRFIEKHWGKGYATESGKAFVDYAFDVMKVEALYAYADEGNENSRKILEKLGMRYVNSFEYEGELEIWYELKNPNL
ncbi:GNAT family N-acetyltransferase [Flavobacterium aquidurense]|jgi:ribosomal-protein-alanine N-acetyltransferase|uniref:GNAT family N-acetyltransferase n=1 Tax=Flavobacterium aquidurense TaxID=362413 RepID=UPI000922D2D4|nr:GNAT family N-acetyltransferase [Flavobacterium aquidurense]OXA67132.1 GNAT family N-acetyltransferase [Flavobacterium aquidurense]SHH10551.1 Protein N-acetyltransferase, RimJ/RimL family [Flavobacterium frigidimaris]